jgi:hypothetical protein
MLTITLIYPDLTWIIRVFTVQNKAQNITFFGPNSQGRFQSRITPKLPKNRIQMRSFLPYPLGSPRVLPT